MGSSEGSRVPSALPLTSSSDANHLNLNASFSPARSTEATTENHPSIIHRLDPVRILCVDDNEVILRLLQVFIKKSEFVNAIVDTATNGEEALILLQTHSYQIVFLDFNMPKGNGDVVALKARAMKCTMPIIGVTAATNMREQCLNCGMNEVVCKPFAKETIQEMLRKYL